MIVISDTMSTTLIETDVIRYTYGEERGKKMKKKDIYIVKILFYMASQLVQKAAIDRKPERKFELRRGCRQKTAADELIKKILFTK